MRNITNWAGRMMPVNWLRWVLICGLWLAGLLHSAVGAQTSLVPAPQRSLALPTVISAFALPSDQVFDPEAVWQTTYSITQPANAQGRLNVSPGQRTVAKFTLISPEEHMYTLEVPLVRMDLVEMFWREPGQPWRQDRAGDTVPLSSWPVVGQFPTFVTHIDTLSTGVDVILVMQNAGTASTHVNVHSDRESRERRLLQASFAGLLIGASAMVLLINLLRFVIHPHRATGCLLVYCAVITAAIAILSGYSAIWFTPELPRVNDMGKPFIAAMSSAAALMACVSTLDRQTFSVMWRRAALVLALLIAGYGVVQVMWLPPTWRLAGAVGGGLATTATVLIVSTIAWYHGDRYARWVIAAVIMFVLSAAVVARGYLEVFQIDVFAFAMAASLIASSLMLRHVLISRDRFGQAVLSRAKTNHLRDPLTALLSYEGFEREVENLNLRQTSEGGIAHLLYFSLTELNNFKHEDGYVVLQRDMVRFAVVLQSVLGESWHIARLSNSKFGAVRLSDQQTVSSEPLLTLILSYCARKIDTYGWVDRVGLRMAGVCAPLTSNGLKESLRLLEDSVQALEPGKRIAQL
jgi:two-component system, sensor histidine kinase LadS